MDLFKELIFFCNQKKKLIFFNVYFSMYAWVNHNQIVHESTYLPFISHYIYKLRLV